MKAIIGRIIGALLLGGVLLFVNAQRTPALLAAREERAPSSRATLNPWSETMANLTITVDEVLLKQARIKALREGTSVNRLLRERLENYVGDDRRRRKAILDLLKLSRSARSGSGGRRVRREDVYGE